MEENKFVLEFHQIENYVTKLQCFPIEDILTSRWIVQSCRLIQLSLQMSLESNQNAHQDVHQQLVLQSKAVVLVWELLTAEAWRRNVVPQMLSNCEVVPQTTLPLQLVLQLEITAAGILENLLFQEESAASIEGLLLDIIDWSVRQLTDIAALIVKQHSKNETYLYSPANEFSRTEAENATTSDDETTQIFNEVKMEIKRLSLIGGLRAIGLFQQMTMHRKLLPLCVGTRLLQTHDVPQLLSTLIERKPWQQVHEGTLYYFEEGQWSTKTLSGFSISKVEVQMWLTIFSLLMDMDDVGGYEITSGRRAALLKLRTFLTETILEEIAALEPLSRFLSSLAMVSAAPPKNTPLVTTLPQIDEAHIRTWKGRWDKLSSFHIKRSFTPEKEALMALASRFAAAYDLEALETLLPQAPTCAMCGEPAGRKCSRCRIQWYCCRSCQVSHWKNHKNLCDIVALNSKDQKSKVIEDIQ